MISYEHIIIEPSHSLYTEMVYKWGLKCSVHHYSKDSDRMRLDVSPSRVNVAQVGSGANAATNYASSCSGVRP